jgi:hypothetical protein
MLDSVGAFHMQAVVQMSRVEMWRIGIRCSDSLAACFLSPISPLDALTIRKAVTPTAAMRKIGTDERLSPRGRILREANFSFADGRYVEIALYDLNCTSRFDRRIPGGAGRR